MKFYKYIFQLLLVCLVFSCGNETKTNNSETKNSVVEKVSKGTSAIEKLRAMNKEKKALKGKASIAVATLENWLPETVLGMQKTKGGALTQDGITGINARYMDMNNQYGKDYANYANYANILIIDGHGEKGSAAALEFISTKYDGNATYDNTTVKEEFSENDNTTTLKFFYNNRFGVEMKTKGFKKNEAWDVFKAFNLDKLTK